MYQDIIKALKELSESMNNTIGVVNYYEGFKGNIPLITNTTTVLEIPPVTDEIILELKTLALKCIRVVVEDRSNLKLLNNNLNNEAFDKIFSYINITLLGLNIDNIDCTKVSDNNSNIRLITVKIKE